MRKRIAAILLLLLFPGIAASQDGIDQPSSILVHIGPPASNTAITTHDKTSIVGTVSRLKQAESCEVVLLSSDDGRVVARTEPDSQGQFRFLNLVPQLFDIVFRTADFEDARLTQIFPGRTFDGLLTLPSRAGVVVDLDASNPYVVDIADITRSYPKKAMDEFEKAVITERVGDTVKAQGILEGLIESTPEFYEAHLMLGAIYQRMGRFRDAEKQYNASRAVSPKQALPMVSLATLYLQEADANENAEESRFVTGVMYDDALHVLQDAAIVDPRNARVFFLLGITFYKTHNDSLAEASLTQALSYDAKMGSARLALANVYIREQKWKDALSQFDAYLADDLKAGGRIQVEAVRARVLQHL
jgi:Flp pilus assembly protein TadD